MLTGDTAGEAFVHSFSIIRCKRILCCCPFKMLTGDAAVTAGEAFVNGFSILRGVN